MLQGLALIDKPEGHTSHDVVARVRRMANTRRVGHAGTLDPMATGLLILGIEQATKLLTFLVGEDKTYETTIRLGAATVTDDREGDVISTADASKLTDEQIRQAIEPLTGEIMQVPSSVSAIKVDGERAYALVRGGDEVKLAARPVTVSRFEVTAIDRAGEFVDVRAVIDCSSGTYIRALARDLGASLGVGGHLTALRRTRIGAYRVEDAKTLEDALEVTSMESAARSQFDCLELTEGEAIDLIHGKRLKAGEKLREPVAAFAPSGRLLAMLTRSGSQYKSLVVFPEVSK
jgi:tRNA pseudouridine55 synthase